MNVEIDVKEAEKIESELEKANRKGQIQKQASKEAESQTTATLLVGSKYLKWPFEGEYWADEINNYRSYLTSQCKEEEE